jgi:hypothetical protein
MQPSGLQETSDRPPPSRLDLRNRHEQASLQVVCTYAQLPIGRVPAAVTVTVGVTYEAEGTYSERVVVTVHYRCDTMAMKVRIT